MVRREGCPSSSRPFLCDAFPWYMYYMYDLIPLYLDPGFQAFAEISICYPSKPENVGLYKSLHYAFGQHRDGCEYQGITGSQLAPAMPPSTPHSLLTFSVSVSNPRCFFVPLLLDSWAVHSYIVRRDGSGRQVPCSSGHRHAHERPFKTTEGIRGIRGPYERGGRIEGSAGAPIFIKWGRVCTAFHTFLLNLRYLEIRFDY